MKKGILFLLSMTLLCADFAYSQVENAQNQADSNITLLDKKAQKKYKKELAAVYEIIGFIELDPASLTPGLDPQTNEKIWFVNQREGAGGQVIQDRILFDSQIIYISYSKSDMVSRISYVERLIRSFNILRTMEATRIIWAVTNASYKTQYIIPFFPYTYRIGIMPEGEQHGGQQKL